MSKTRKLDPEKLPGKRSQRVFVGGQYDFMPTLRIMAQFIKDISSPEKTFFSVIPYDYEMRVEETMDVDLRILVSCRYAIFDLSDLGAQLVEMQEARQKLTSIQTLLVYPVRDRRNEPERGRRTVLSFGLPHFGYTRFDELKGIVWRFLMDAPTEKDYPPRVIHDPLLDCEIRRTRVFLGKGKPEHALKIINTLLGKKQYKEALEPWLQLALIACRNLDGETCKEALNEAKNLSNGDEDEAEIWYYRGIIERLQPTPNWKKVKTNLAKAEKLKPEDGRILQLLGLAFWELEDRKAAIEKTKKALKSRDIPDPVVAIQVVNNLAYFICEQVQEGNDTGGKNLEEALELSKYLPAYQTVFRRRSVSWLDTRGFALLLKAQALIGTQRKEEAKEELEAALLVLTEAVSVDATNEYAQAHLEEARNLSKSL